MTDPHLAKPEDARCRTYGGLLRRPPALVAPILAVGVMLALALCLTRSHAAEPAKPAKPAKQDKQDKQDKYAWRPLFDGKTLKGWKAPNFGGEGKVEVRDGVVLIDMGESMSGITYTGQLPKIDYELSLEAKRTKGNDFFATTTFPVGDSNASFVVGGWGGTVVGISSIDHFDASENPTTKFASFKDNQWYKVRIRVTKARIECWIDDEKQVDFETKEHKISIRMECDLCRPLGISTWCTATALRHVKIRNLPPDEAAAQPAKSE